MKRFDELGISPMPWESHKQFVIAADDGSVVAATNVRDARLIAAAPELMSFALAYCNRYNTKNAVKTNPLNGDKYQGGLLQMCKTALVKAGAMDESEVWEVSK